MENQYNLQNLNFFNPKNFGISLESHWQPFFDDRADFNTNARTYYEYLAHLNNLTVEMVNLLNRVARRNITLKDTNSVDLTKKGDWISENDCNKFSDVITLQADVIISKHEEIFTKTKTKDTDKEFSVNLKNSIKILNDGLFAKDYDFVIDEILKIIDDLSKEINDVSKKLDTILKDVDKKLKDFENDINKKINEKLAQLASAEDLAKVKTALQNIINNLVKTGAWNGELNSLNGNLNPSNNIATGNINLFGQDFAHFIRTQKQNEVENSLKAGL